MSREYLVGVASSIVTPSLGCNLAGFDARKGVAQHVHDDLHARSLVIDDGTTQVVLVSIEVLGVSAEFTHRVQAEIERITGIPASHIVLSATHTHCGPVTFNHFFNHGQPLDDSYLDRLAKGIVASVEKAYVARQPSRIRCGFVYVENLAVNRRTADGQPIDPNAGVLLVEDQHGSPLAIAVNYACHTTVLGPNTLDITADFPYYMGRYLQQQLGAATEVLYFNGAEGDISVGHKSDLSAVGVIAPFRTFEKAEELGVKLGKAVADGISTLTLETGFISAKLHTLHLPLKRYEPLPLMASRRSRAFVTMQSLETTLAAQDLLQARQSYLFRRIEEYYASLWEQEASHEPKTLTTHLTAIRIGNTAFLAFPGEVFVEIALAIRATSPFPQTMFLGLANDYIGYVPTNNAVPNSGYEVVASRVTPDASDCLIRESNKLLMELAQ